MLVAAVSAALQLPVCWSLSPAARDAESTAACMSRLSAYAREPSIAMAAIPINTVSMSAMRTMACPACFLARWGRGIPTIRISVLRPEDRRRRADDMVRGGLGHDRRDQDQVEPDRHLQLRAARCGVDRAARPVGA